MRHFPERSYYTLITKAKFTCSSSSRCRSSSASFVVDIFAAVSVAAVAAAAVVPVIALLLQ